MAICEERTRKKACDSHTHTYSSSVQATFHTKQNNSTLKRTKCITPAQKKRKTIKKGVDKCFGNTFLSHRLGTEAVFKHSVQSDTTTQSCRACALISLRSCFNEHVLDYFSNWNSIFMTALISIHIIQHFESPISHFSTQIACQHYRQSNQKQQ